MARKKRSAIPRKSGKKEICKKCGKLGFVAKRDSKKQSTCVKCYHLTYYHNPANHERCIDCGKVKPVARRRNDWALCSSCARKDATFHEICFFCDTLKAVAKYNSFDKPVCQSCLNKGYGGPPLHVGFHTLEIRGITPLKDLFRRFDVSVA